MSPLSRTQFWLASLVVLLALFSSRWLEAAWSNPGAGPPFCAIGESQHCAPPLNASSTVTQIKGGNLTLGNLAATKDTVITKKLGIGPIFNNGNFSAIDPSVTLDIDGVIRIRGGVPGVGKVLYNRSVADTKSYWGSILRELWQGEGVIFTGGNPITNDTPINPPPASPPTPNLALDFTTAQKRVSGNCATSDPPAAMNLINSLGTVGCDSFVNHIFINPGFTLIIPGFAPGRRDLRVNPGDGLQVTGGPLALIPDPYPTFHDGLELDAGTLRVSDNVGPCVNSNRWLKWRDSSYGWECADAYFSDWENRPGGNLLRIPSLDSAGVPPACSTLAGGAWTDVGLSTEYVNTTGNFNYQRHCENTTQVCQVRYLKSLPSCFAWLSLGSFVEYTGGSNSTSTSNVRVCTFCQTP